MRPFKYRLRTCFLVLCLMLCMFCQSFYGLETLDVNDADVCNEINANSNKIEAVSTHVAAITNETVIDHPSVKPNMVELSRTKQEVLLETPPIKTETVEVSEDLVSEEKQFEERIPTDWHADFINMVRKLDGMGTYCFGSKADVSDYENMTAYLNGSLDKENIELALDCSGFIQLVYWLWTGTYDESLASTYMISRNCDVIEMDELKPGDLGMIFADGTYYETPDGEIFYEYESVKWWAADDETRNIDDVTAHVNHVGIFLGCDDEGNMIWAHCNKKTGNITINNHQGFTCYYRVNPITE